MSLRQGLASQAEVVHAIILRETRTRFGAHQLGYLWALLEPALFILTFYILFNIGGRRTPFGMDMFGFLATGVVPFLLFNNSVGQVSASIVGNRALLFYPHVQTLDLAIARSLLELGTFGAVFLVLMGGSALTSQHLEVADPLLILWGFVLASALGTTIGLIFCTLAQFSSVVTRAQGPLMRPFFWVSGVFFAAEGLPEHIREPFMLNPVLHVTEFVRAGWYPNYSSPHTSSWYVLSWIVALAFVGLSLERVVRRRIELT